MHPNDTDVHIMDTADQVITRLDDARSGARLLRVSERGFHNLRKRPGFPPQVELFPGRPRWLREQLVEYAKSLPAVAQQPEPERLQAARNQRRPEVSS